MASQSRTASGPVGAGAITGPLNPCGGSVRTTIVGVWVFGPPKAYATSMASRIGTSHLSSSAAALSPGFRPAAETHSVKMDSAAGRVPGEVPPSPFRVQALHDLLPLLGARRLEDAQHAVTDGMAVQGLLSVRFRNGGRHAVVVPNLEAVGAPEDHQLPLRRHLSQPTGSDPGPRAAGIDEDLDVSHSRTVTGAAVELSHDIDQYAPS